MKSFGECFFCNTLQLRLVHKTKRYLTHWFSSERAHSCAFIATNNSFPNIHSDLSMFTRTHDATQPACSMPCILAFLNFFVVVWLKCFQLWKICCYCMTIWLWLDFSCWLDSANRRLAYKHFCSCSWEYNIEYMHVAGVVCFTPCTCGKESTSTQFKIHSGKPPANMKLYKKQLVKSKHRKNESIYLLNPLFFNLTFQTEREYRREKNPSRKKQR